MGENALKTGSKIRLDGKYSGFVRYKGPLEGRKGDWLGLEMDDTVGDNDGSIGGKSYFKTHDGQGIFLREESGRAVEVSSGTAKIPEEMLEHMKFLFASFDSDSSGDINQEELYQAMQQLGQKGTRKHVKHIFEEIDLDHSGSIDFHEFIEVMQVQWKGIDLGRAVKMIKAQEEEEARAAGDIDLAPVEVLYATICGVKLHLRYFGAGMNGFLLFVYGLLALAATWYLLLEVTWDLFNQLLVISLGSMSALFAIGGYTIHTHSWVTIKVYAVLMFFGAGAQLTMCCMYHFKFFTVSETVVKIVMDEKCGTCLGDSSDCNTVSMTGSLLGNPDIDYSDMPWYCCCALNECFDFSTVVTQAASCNDGCALADLTGTETESRLSCMAQGAIFAGEEDRGLSGPPCQYVGYVAPVEQSCSCVGAACLLADDPCVYIDSSSRYARTECANVNPAGSCAFEDRVREEQKSCVGTPYEECYSNRQSNSTCRGQGTCVFAAAQYGAEVQLDADMTKANTFCSANADFDTHSALAIEGSTSRLGNTRCFVKETDGITKGSMGKCVEEYQNDSQKIYIIFILVLWPLQMVAAYVGWVLPDLYFKAHHQSKEDEAMAAHATAFEQESDTANPVATDSENK